MSDAISGSGYGLDTIKDGQVPETRMRDASQVVDFVRRLWEADEKRAKKRSLVDGLVAGNPPYRPAKLRDAGRADACNVNWGTGRMYLESGSGAFYDLATEAPGLVEVRTSHGTDEEQDTYSRVMSSEADRILLNDESWDFEVQTSQEQMTSHGRGPFMFEDEFKVLPIAIHDGDLKVPDRTRADTKYWEVCSVDRDYYPPELYEFIKDEEAAAQVGWDVEFTKKVIEYAMDILDPNGNLYNWEFYAQELKANSLHYVDTSLVCHIAHVFWKEFDGSITHAIVERESTGTTEKKYLFFKRGRYDNFKQAIHPFYFDRGQGGFHHTVTGLGVKMFSAMEYENRLMCRLMDGAFAPKVLFKPTSSEVTQKMQLATMGDYGVVPAGWDMQQVPVQGFLQDGLAMFRTSSELMRGNLSNYRQSVPMKQEGNPVTARQVMHDATTQSSLTKTTYARFYKQQDQLYEEIVRRLCNLNSIDKRAKEYQKRCIDKGVPKECFGRIDTVRAVRIVGQGNAFMRKAAIDSMMPVVSSLPEEGKQRWIDDKISVEVGQAAVARYNPKQTQRKMGDEQDERAMNQIADMKIGVAPVIASSQNPLRFAGHFLNASVQAIQSVQQGGNPQEVIRFVDLSAPACLAHIKRIINDPLRQETGKMMLKQLQQLGKLVDRLKKMVQQQQQQRQQQSQKTSKVMTDAELKVQKAKADEMRKNLKLRSQLQRDSVTTRQQLALNDARAASEIQRANRLAAFND